MLLAFSTVADVLIKRQLLLALATERAETILQQDVEEFRRLVRHGRNPRTGEPLGTDIRSVADVHLSRNAARAGEDFFIFVDGRLYRTTARPHSELQLIARMAPVASTRVVRRGSLDAVSDGEVVAYLAVPVRVEGRQRGVFAAAIALGGENEIARVVQVDAGVSLGVAILAVALVFGATGRLLTPLRQLSETARSISETDLTRRTSVVGDDEIAEVARTFNAMLDRLERAFASQRAFVSDAVHELRTPITIVRGQLELLGDDANERQETIALVHNELDVMSRSIEDLLMLARSEHPDFLKLEDIDLDILTEELATKASALAPRDWRTERVGTGQLRGDSQRLTQAVMNLVQNAVQHTEPGDVIVLGSELRDGHARLWVGDTGPGVAEADRELIFQRFARADHGRRRSEGAGLGLAIVRVIAEAHGGRVKLSSRCGQGATFTIEVPLTQAKGGTR